MGLPQALVLDHVVRRDLEMDMHLDYLWPLGSTGDTKVGPFCKLDRASWISSSGRTVEHLVVECPE